MAGELSLAVVRLARRLRGRRNAKVISLTQLSALNTLHHEGPMTPGALASAERVQPPSMTRVLASLSDLGMIERRPHPTDGRQSIVTLSQRGEEVITAELVARREWLSEQIEALDAADRAALRDVVDIMNKIVATADVPKGTARIPADAPITALPVPNGSVSESVIA